MTLIGNTFPGSVRYFDIKNATAYSEHGRFKASNMVDGNTSTFYASSDTGTQYPWVQLELTDTESVQGVVVTNRLDCCGERFAKVEVRVGDSEVTKENERLTIHKNEVCGEYVGPAETGEIVNINCSIPLTGRYVTIQVTDSQIQILKLYIAEVKIYTQGNSILS